MNHPFYNLEGLPTPDQDKKFWDLVEHQDFKHTVNFLIINELRKFDPAMLNNDQCRTQLSKLKAWQELLDLPTAISGADQDKIVPHEKLP
jgi:hypothetical protein